MGVSKLKRTSCWLKLAITLAISVVCVTLLVANEMRQDTDSWFRKSVRGKRSQLGEDYGDSENTRDSKPQKTPGIPPLTVGSNSDEDIDDNVEGIRHPRTARSSVLDERANGIQRRRSIVTQGGADSDPDVAMKREFVRKMMLESWNAYKASAWGANELAPVAKRGLDGGSIFGSHNMGATIIDSLSTLYIMGMNEEFDRARNWTANEFHFKNICSGVSLFESTIRFLGGLLSAYALSQDRMFVEKASEVADSLLPAFDTTYGIPHGWVTPCRQAASSYSISLAELGTLHLEFVYLSAVTRKPIYAQKVQRIRQRLQEILPDDGLYKNTMSVDTGTFISGTTSMGGGADSFYEYLLKSWVMTGDRKARKAYDATMEAMRNAGMFRVSSPSHLLYIATRQSSGRMEQSFSHLSCFSGGMLALGAVTDPKPTERTFDALKFGANITNTCHESYIRTPTHLGPEDFTMDSRNEARSNDFMASYYILRPEVIESYFYLYRLTKDQKYRDWAWDAAQAIYRYCRVNSGDGYSGLKSVNTAMPRFDDTQQSFFLAETLKYLYLIFSSDDLLDLNVWVFNTEAHPLPIRGKNPMYPTARRKQRRPRN